MSRRRIADVYRDLAVCHQESASLLRELACITDGSEVSSDSRGPGRARRPPRVVRPTGESDQLSARRAEQILRRGGLVSR
jgi:hypothetical protein